MKFIVDDARFVSHFALMRLRDQLLTISAAYAAAIGRSEARVATIVFGAGNSLSRLRSGADMGSERIHDGLQWFSDHWPADTPWPAGIARPVPQPGQASRSSPAPQPEAA